MPSARISEQTRYRWKAKYGGMKSSDAKRLKALERKNRKLKHVVAELMLDNRALKDVCRLKTRPYPSIDQMCRND